MRVDEDPVRGLDGGVRAGVLLSIVIPCLDRHEMLLACLGSIDSRDEGEIEIVVVDDGSDPPLAPVLGALLREGDQLLRQANRGRAVALRAGLLASRGAYVMAMDSDDEFIPGVLGQVLADIRGGTSEGQVGFVYECRHFDDDGSFARLPDGTRATLLGLRADLGVKGDLKEVIQSFHVKACLYPDPGVERRVPTSYIWGRVSTAGHVLTRPTALVRHRYLGGGMTRSIARLKRESPYWLARTYLVAATAPASVYRSRSFRIRNAIKTFSVGNARLEDAEIRQLRSSLGSVAFCFSALAGRVIRAWRSP